MIIHKLVFSPIMVNTYIVEGISGTCAVIDCGCYSRKEFEEFEKFLDKKKLIPGLLLNTHMHLDHIFGNGFMLEKYNLRTWCHTLDEMNRERAIQDALLFGLKMETPPEPEGYLEDGGTVSLGNLTFKALHVPGHTSGSLAYYCESEGCVFTGDALFAGNIGRSDLPGGNHDTLVRSIKAKLFSLPPDTIVYPGHGDKTDIISEMRFNPFFS
ncbi:MAG TPA: MBL fold metallo-hydrolase [Bacteroidales bacterium]|nr:MBL fold metallo-hydrolase [Bacteroidales bacterium]